MSHASSIVLTAACTLLATPASANDSIAETALGGLTLTRSDAISMDSEDLYLSRDHVHVRYRFTNRTDQPIDTLVAFPLPEIPADASAEEQIYWRDAASDLKFTTRVDGHPLHLDIVEQALVRGVDVSPRLRVLGVPLNRFASGFSKAINRLAPRDRDRLIADGMLRSDGSSDQPLWAGLWSLRTTVTRHQVFPAHRTITVEHDYVPMAGGSVGGLLDPKYRSQADTRDYFAAARRKYCIDDSWLRRFDATLARRPANASLPYSEVWLGYVLSTGANWKGPIGEFRLVVDKGKVSSLVSFCASDVKKISPTRFEVRRRNYTPASDLGILIVDFDN